MIAKTNKILRQCAYCHQEFLAFPSLIKAGGAKYCKNHCRLKHKNEIKKENDRIKNLIIKRKIHSSKMKECLMCGKQFKVYSCNLEKGMGKFCAISCATQYRIHVLNDHPLINRGSYFEKFFNKISKEDHEKGCWIWIGHKNKAGYGRIRQKYKDKTAHRFSWEIFNGPIPESMFICHTCDNPPCCNPDHLFLGTPKDNTQDCIKKNRQRYQKGSAHNMAKLSESEIPKIRELLKNGEKQYIIARMFNVSPMIISKIKHRKLWNHV
jgi:hypothetical protein